MANEPKRRGRPTKPPAPGATKVSLGVLVTPEVKAWLTQRAAANGRTQSQEAAWLMEQGLLRETEQIQQTTKGQITVDQMTDMIERMGNLERLVRERVGD